MAKSRADSTPAKATGKKKAATPSPAKKTKAVVKSESPERRVTRSSPRRPTLSTKAQEATAVAEKVQAGRVTKKTSPKKASPAKTKAQAPVVEKAASPAKAKAQTPVAKKTVSPTKAKAQTSTKETTASPASGKVSKATTPTSKASSRVRLDKDKLKELCDHAQSFEMPQEVYVGTHATVSRTLAPPPRQKGDFATAPPNRPRGKLLHRDHDEYVSHSPSNIQGKVLSLSCAKCESSSSIEKARIDNFAKNLTTWMDNALEDRRLREVTLTHGISMLKGAVAALGEHDAIGLPLEDPQTLHLRSIGRKVWMTMRGILGVALDDYLDKEIPDRIFMRALLRVQPADWSDGKLDPKRVWDLDNVVPVEYGDVVEQFGKYTRDNNIDSSPPRSPPRSGSEEQQGCWDYWADHPESEDEGFPSIFSRAAAPAAKKPRGRPRGPTNKAKASPTKATRVSSLEDEYDDGKDEYMEIPAQRTASEIVAGPPKGKRPVAKTVDYDALGYKERLELASNEQYRKQEMNSDADRMTHWLEHELEAPGLEQRHFSFSYYMLKSAIRLLDRHDAKGLDWAEARRLRTLCQELWTLLHAHVGRGFVECLNRGVPGNVFGRALVKVQGPVKGFWIEEEKEYRYGWRLTDLVPLHYDEDVVDLFEQWKRDVGDSDDNEPTTKQAPSVSRRGASLARLPAAAEAAAAPPSKRAQSKSPTKRAQSESPTKRASSPRKSSSSSDASSSSASSSSASNPNASNPNASASDASSSEASSTVPSYVYQNVRGKIVSPTNPAMITDLRQANRFHETLPAPEVWHRRMPPYFTFGETPYMQQLASDQIQDDLNRNTEERAKAAKGKEPLWKKAVGTGANVLGSIRGFFPGTAAKQQQPKGCPSPWDLPEVSEEELETEMAIQRVDGENSAAITRGSKRPASPRKTSSPTKKPSSSRKTSSLTKKPSSPMKKPASPRKIPQRETEDEDASTDEDGDYVMSGGLH